MTNFYVAAAVLTLVALGLLLIPRWHSRRWQGESNLDWLTLRQSELESSGLEEQQTLSRDAELRILDETPEPPSEVAFESTGKFAGGTGGALLLVSTVVIVPVLLYFFLGAIEDVRITAALDNMQDASPAEVQSLVADIEVRSNAKPGNVEYLSLLGEYYTAQNEHVQALEIYEQLLQQFPESAELLARAAQAEYLKGERLLTDQARRRAEAALAINPEQRSALGTLGMAAFETGNYNQALQYWERLLEFEAPGSPGFQMLTTIIAEAKTRGGLSNGAAVSTAPPKSAAEATPGVGVTVNVAMPEGRTPLGTVFIVARPSGATQRMPTAAVRRSANELPFSVRLDDASSMAGQKISALNRVDVEVQVSATGQPGRANASWLVTAVNVEPTTDAVIHLTLEAVEP
ncbi:MAG: tetratricopeptide repeat protein [Luminiphilus sp.]|nr:tetratricopeptide repeat protein [Luminiphilus sp.]MDG1459930.1 tetratricopeptide repeat protein [Luminiphilus sp.]